MPFKIQVAAPILTISLALAALPTNALGASLADSVAAATVSTKPVTPSTEGPWFSAHLGPAWPAGQFKAFAATGVVGDLSVWLTGRTLAYGIRTSLIQFGGVAELEQLLYGGTSGKVNQVRYTFFGISATSRLRILPNARCDPFVQVGSGIQRFKTTLEGPNVKGSNSEIALSSDVGLGIHLNMRGGLAAELLWAYTLARAGESITVADGAVLFSNGTIGYFQIKAGLVRRLGGR
jgi:opacity protein-like surface antigen